MILDMLDKDAGSVLWNGKPLSFADCNIGYLAEERGLYPKYSLLDQIMYFASLRDVPAAVAKTGLQRAKNLRLRTFTRLIRCQPTAIITANHCLGGLASHKGSASDKTKES